MQRFDGRDYPDPPDLLRRFVSTPLTSLYRVNAVNVIVKTNDITLLPAPEVNFEAFGTNNFEWKLIRDLDCLGLLGQPMCITSGPLTFVGMGPACLIGVDRKRRELMAVLGGDIDRHTYQDRLVPLFCELTSDTSSASMTLPSEVYREASANE